jgi:hypothetical protein
LSKSDSALRYASIALHVLFVACGAKRKSVPAVDVEAACDAQCAKARVIALEVWARAARQYDLHQLALAFGAALDRSDCDAARELSSALLRNKTAASTMTIEGQRHVDATLAGYRGTLGKCPATAFAALPNDAAITLERRTCYGPCPAYTLTVRADGRVSYIGQSSVEVTGPAEAWIDPAEVVGLFHAFESLHFRTRPVSYESHGSDEAGAKLSLRVGAQVYAVNDDATCWQTAAIADGICYLQNRVDEVAQSHRWIKKSR